MPKAGEQAYLAQAGDAGRQHMLGKPFTDRPPGYNLTAIGTVISLLPAQPARILDMGCGSGWTSLFMARCGFHVTGQDLASDMIDLAWENARAQGMEPFIDFVVGDFEALEFSEQFDAVVFFDSLHHAEDEALAIRSAWKALKPGGVLITHEPGEGHATHPHSIEAMERYGVTERDMPPHLIIRRGKEAGFTDFHIYPMPNYLHRIFYEQYRPERQRLHRRLRWARRALRLLFRPDDREGAIVIMTK